jgi:hypothetical protein
MARKRKARQYAEVPAPSWDPVYKLTHIPALPDGYEGECPHPGPSTWAWFAYDGTFCTACCACGAVTNGGVTLPSKEEAA